MRLRLLATIALILAPVWACAAQSQDARTAGTDSLNAKLQKGIAEYDAGRRAEAYRIFDSFIDDYNNAGGRMTAAQLTAVGTAMRYLGQRDPQLYKDAVKALDEAVAADPRHHEARIALGHLFLEKYNSADARKAFDEVLRDDARNPDALVGLATVLAFDNQPGAVENARKALAVNARHTGAHAFLTHAFLQTEALDSARVHADLATSSAAGSIDALIAAAAVAHSSNNSAALAQLRTRIAANTTATSRLALALAELSVQQRQYANAVKLAREAIAADSLNWRAWSVLGINQLRLGDAVAARQSLERSFAGDPYNVWVKNTLDLLDQLDKFATRSSQHFTILAHGREVDVLAPYASALAEEAFAKLAQRYGYTPPTPVRVEIFNRHADFSVRTVGLAGLGALGVSFGSVLAMDAPSARERGDFNWGSTLWHELAHAFHLGMTEHRVPRWFTEGLAVLEERRARPGWGEEGLPMFVRAAREKQLLPLAELNNGFVRPTYPQQVAVSYYQASLMLEMIEQKYGANVLRDMLRAYAKGAGTNTAIRDVLKTTPAALDKEFERYTEQRVTDMARIKSADIAGSYESLVAEGSIAALENAIYISPYDAALHTRLAELYARSGNKAGVVRERQVIVALNPVDVAEARYQLALAHYDAGDMSSARQEVLRALEAAPNFERAQELLLKLRAQGQRP